MIVRAPLKNLLVMVLLLTIGLSLAPYIVGVVMDVFAVSVHSATGWDLGVGFVENSLGMWPGGEMIAAIMFHAPMSAAGLISGLFQVFLVIALRTLVPPLLAGENTDFRVGRILAIGMVDSLITCLIAIGVSWLFSLGMNNMFTSSITGTFAQILVGVGLLVAFALAALHTLGFLRGGDSDFNFSIITSTGRFALTTFALISWSLYGLVGALTVVLCIAGCTLLALVDGRESGYW